MFLGTLGLIKGSLIATKPTVYTEDNFKPGQLPIIEKPTGNKIIINEDGTSLILKAGTYKAIKETQNWETGEMFIPEYTFDSDTEFSYTSSTNSISLFNEQPIQIETSEISGYEWIGSNTDAYVIDATKGTTFKGDHTWKARTSNIPASTNLTYRLKFINTSNVYKYDTNISLSYAYIGGQIAYSLNLNLNIMKDNTLVETVLTGSRDVAVYNSGTHYMNGKIRKLNEDEYLELLINIPTALYISGFSTWGTLKISNFNYTTYSSTPIKIGLEKMSSGSGDRYYLHEDYQQIWNLGSIEMSDTDTKMVAYIPPETT